MVIYVIVLDKDNVHLVDLLMLLTYYVEILHVMIQLRGSLIFHNN